MVDEGRVARLEHGVVEHDVAARMGRAVGFRNVLVHQYAVVDDGRVVAHLDELGDLRAFVEQVSSWMVRWRRVVMAVGRTGGARGRAVRW